MEYILITCIVIIVLFIVLKLFRVSFKWIMKILLNAIVGGVLLYLINLIPNVNLPINWVTSIAVGIFGVPALLVILILTII